MQSGHRVTLNGTEYSAGPLIPKNVLETVFTGTQNGLACILRAVKIPTGHWSLSAVTHAPFHASELRTASQVGPMHNTAGMGKLMLRCSH